MVQVYACVVVMVCLCHVVIGQLDDGERPDEWESSLIPNPAQDPQHCRLGLQPGFICDPDGLLTQRQMELVDWLLRGFYDNDTMCTCSAYWCEKSTKKGTHFSMAIVKKMKVPDVYDDPNTAVMQAASNFAFDLQDKQWKFGTCRNNMVLFYSRDDQVLFISEGPITRKVLRPEIVDNIQRMFGHHFRKDGNLFTGLAEIIVAVRSTLNGNNYYDPKYAETPIGGTSHVIPGCLATILLTLSAMFLS